METNMFPPAAHQQQGVSLTDNGASRQQQPSSNMGMVRFTFKITSPTTTLPTLPFFCASDFL